MGNLGRCKRIPRRRRTTHRAIASASPFHQARCRRAMVVTREVLAPPLRVHAAARRRRQARLRQPRRPCPGRGDRARARHGPGRRHGRGHRLRVPRACVFHGPNAVMYPEGTWYAGLTVDDAALVATSRRVRSRRRGATPGPRRDSSQQVSSASRCVRSHARASA